jgi:uncharacterized protein YcbK (DUF882 family)
MRSSRARRSCGLAALILLMSCEGLQTAIAEGETRTLSMHHIHTDESITITYKRNGRYDEEALKKLNWFLRDWRREQEINMDPRLFDIIWEVNREVHSQKPIDVVCGYRSPQTNAMLRRRSGGVARFSQHMLGHAMDFYIPDAALEDVRNAGLRLQRGGVGFYPTSGSPFVHLDTGNVRHWPRMTHDQLARVFPDGRTVHVPSDGRPLAGYALALADIQKRGNSPSEMSLDAARDAGVATAEAPKRNLFATLFGSRKEEDEDSDSEGTAAALDRAPPATSTRQTAAIVAPQPKAAPSQTASQAAAAPAAKAPQPSTYQLASVPTLAPTFAPVHAAPAPGLAPVSSANDVIASRGDWNEYGGGADQKGKVTAQATTGTTRPRPAAQPTAKTSPWSSVASVADTEEDQVPQDALAYATPRDVETGTQSKPATARAAPMGAVATRAYAVTTVGPSAMTSALPRSPVALQSPPQTAVPQPAPTASAAPARAATAVSVKVGDQFDNPWLRALVIAPDIQNYMTVTSFDPPDFRRLRLMMEKPEISIRMTFSSDPHRGLATDHFSGNAVVFLSTISFLTRTASLQ